MYSYSSVDEAFTKSFEVQDRSDLKEEIFDLIDSVILDEFHTDDEK